MRYDYRCQKCFGVQEEVHGMLEKPCIVCMRCGDECFKMICVNTEQIFAANVPLWDFIDRKTTIAPVRIKSKRQWQEHLKRVGQVEAPNVPPSKESIIAAERTRKMTAKQELKKAVVLAVKDKKHIRETKQKIIQKGGG